MRLTRRGLVLAWNLPSPEERGAEEGRMPGSGIDSFAKTDLRVLYPNSPNTDLSRLTYTTALRCSTLR